MLRDKRLAERTVVIPWPISVVPTEKMAEPSA
jgi:hypothetical protein